MKIFNYDEIDTDSALKLIKAFLDNKTLSISKGRFPINLPRLDQKLINSVRKQCYDYNNGVTNDFNITSSNYFKVNLGSCNYRLEDISQAMNAMKVRGVTDYDTITLGVEVSGDMNLRHVFDMPPVVIFLSELNQCCEKIFKSVIKKEHKVGMISSCSTSVIDNNPMNLSINFDIVIYGI